MLVFMGCRQDEPWDEVDALLEAIERRERLCGLDREGAEPGHRCLPYSDSREGQTQGQ